MNYSKRLLIIWSPILFYFLIVLLIEIRSSFALQDYSMLPSNVEVVDKIVLGRRGRSLATLGSLYSEFENGIIRAFRRGAINLVCTNQDKVLLLVQDFRLVRSVEPGLSGKGIISIGIGNLGGETEIRQIKFLSREYFDTFVSSPLTIQEQASIIKALERTKSNRVSLYVFDGSDPFSGKAKVSEVKKLIDNCQK